MNTVRNAKVYLTESRFVMGKGVAFTGSVVSSTTRLFADKWWYVDGAFYYLYRLVFRKFEGIPGAFIQDSWHLHGLMSICHLPMERVQYN